MLVSVLFQLCGLLAFGVLNCSTTQESLVSVMWPMAIFEDYFVFSFALICGGEIRSLGRSLRHGAPPSEALHSSASFGD